MFYLIGLGLGDAKDITVKGLEIVKKCDKVLLEAYTSILTVGKEALEEFYGRSLLVADRELCESNIDDILQEAKDKDIALLVVGDPLGATTHTDMLLRAHQFGVKTQIVHNASIMNAVSCCGLQLYNFGETVSIPYWTETWKPDSFFDKIVQNYSRNLHTLCLLDIKVKEPTEESLTKKVREYMEPKFMSVKEAASQLIQIIENRPDTGKYEYVPDTIDDDMTQCDSQESLDMAESQRWDSMAVNIGDKETTTERDTQTTSSSFSSSSTQTNFTAIDEEKNTLANNAFGALVGHELGISMDSLAVGLSRVGAGEQRVAARPLAAMQRCDLGAPLHSLVIPAPNLHPLELDYLAQFR